MTMYLKKSRFLPVAAAFASVVALALPSHAAPKPTPMRVGQTVSTTLEESGSQDYSVSLGAGTYRIVWDAERVEGTSSNIIGKVQLLKPNGVIIDSRLLNFNEVSVNGRVGVTYRAPKPFVARLRVINESKPAKMWLTVVPVAQKQRVPFGWGAQVTPARIAADNGVGGTLEANAVVFHSITLPKGKWSISLGLSLPEGEKSNLLASIDMLDAQGLTLKSGLVNMNEIENQARTEGIVNITKPTPILLRVENTSGGKEYTYDVTIDKAQ